MRKAKAIVVGLDAVSMPMIRRFVDEGVMPNTKRMMRKGISGDIMPSIPAYTPTNWATIATGAHPGTTGAANWADNRPGDRLEREPLSTFDSRAIKAETIFEVADRQGLRSVAVAYPGSYPTRTKRGFVVAPIPRGLVSLRIQPGAVYCTPNEGLPKTEQIRLKKVRGWRGLGVGEAALAGEISMSAKVSAKVSSVSGPEAAKKAGATEDGAEIEAMTRVGAGKAGEERLDEMVLNVLVKKGKRGYEKVIVCEGKDTSKKIAEMAAGKWSKWAALRVPGSEGRRKGTVRFRLIKLSRDGKRMILLRSEVYPTSGFTHPKSLSAELLEKVGPYMEHSGASTAGLALMGVVMEEMKYQVDWQVKAAAYLMETRGWDIFYNHWHFPDSVEHFFLAPADPESPAYNKKLAKKALDVLRKAYALGDRLIGGLMKMADEKTFVALISDHGNAVNKFSCDSTKMLTRKGLTVFDEAPQGIAMISHGMKINWKKSRAYPYGGAQICVNLKGREPYGIVSPKDYEKVQEEIIDALLDWREPKTGKRAVALALKKKDAQLIGYWGEHCGDVVFIYNSGFAWGHSPGSSTISVSRGGANHGPQIPTTSTRLSSNMAALVLMGPGLKRGHERDTKKLGCMNLVDFVPTLCYGLGIEPPGTSQGAVMLDLFTDSARRRNAAKGRRKEAG
jgi:predicted AlkP superfamily phosphohydrolase/phosphomutase